MMFSQHARTFLIVIATGSLVVGCPDSNSDSDAATPEDAHVAQEDAAVATDAAHTDAATDAHDASTPTNTDTEDAAGASTDASVEDDAAVASTAPCSFSVSGGRTDPTTDAPYACANGHIEQLQGQGDYTASIGAGFQGAANEIITLTCTLSSATPPSPGSTWTLGTGQHSGGNCSLGVIAGGTSTSWVASGNTAVLTGSASITFVSATLMHGTAHPEDVYYTYDITLDASLKAQTAGAEDVTIHGRLSNDHLISGS